MSTIAGHLIAAVVGWLATNVDNALNMLWDLLSSSLLRSPDVTRLPQVQEFAGTSLGVVNTAYILAVFAVAFMIMGRGTLSTQSPYGPGELIPRLVVGWLGANFALPALSMLVGLANALTEALTDQPIQSPDSLAYLRQLVKSALVETPIGPIPGAGPSAPNAFLLILIGLIIAVLLGMLLCQQIIRLGTLVVLAGIAPFALAMHGTPWTEPAAKLWWRAVFGTLGTVAAQAFTLHVALRLLLTPSANLPVLGLPGEPGATMNLLIVVCILLGVVKIPALMKRYVTRSGSGSGRVIGFLMLQQVTRAVTGGLRLPGAGRRAAAGARSRAADAAADGAWPMGSQPPAGEGRGPGRRYSGQARRPASGTRPKPSGRSALGSAEGTSAKQFRRPYRPPRTSPRPATPPKPYTPQELAEGVDLYTRRMRRRSG